MLKASSIDIYTVNAMPADKNAFAEVIESSLKLISALCWDDAALPHFGSIVEVSYNNCTSYGIITEITAKITDDQRTPFAFKKNPEQLQRDQPQIFAFMQTTCTISMIWHSTTSASIISSRTAPTPAPLHTPVRNAPRAIWREILLNHELLFAITERIPSTTADDCLLVIAEQAAESGEISATELHEFIEIYAREINNDLHRAQRFLQHMERALKRLRML